MTQVQVLQYQQISEEELVVPSVIGIHVQNPQPISFQLELKNDIVEFNVNGQVKFPIPYSALQEAMTLMSSLANHNKVAPFTQSDFQSRVWEEEVVTEETSPQ